MQVTEFPDHYWVCFSSCDNNFARQLPAALVAVILLLLLTLVKVMSEIFRSV